MVTEDLPRYSKKTISYDACKFLKDLEYKTKLIKPLSDDRDYVENNYINNKFLWLAIGELVQRELVIVNNLKTFTKFYHTHVHSWAITWSKGEYESLTIKPTIKGAWLALCHQKNS